MWSTQRPLTQLYPSCVKEKVGVQCCLTSIQHNETCEYTRALVMAEWLLYGLPQIKMAVMSSVIQTFDAAMTLNNHIILTIQVTCIGMRTDVQYGHQVGHALGLAILVVCVVVFFWLFYLCRLGKIMCIHYMYCVTLFALVQPILAQIRGTSPLENRDT